MSAAVLFLFVLFAMISNLWFRVCIIAPCLIISSVWLQALVAATAHLSMAHHLQRQPTLQPCQSGVSLLAPAHRSLVCLTGVGRAPFKCLALRGGASEDGGDSGETGGENGGEFENAADMVRNVCVHIPTHY